MNVPARSSLVSETSEPTTAPTTEPTTEPTSEATPQPDDSTSTTPSPTPSESVPSPTPTPDVTVCGVTASTPCHVHVPEPVLQFAGLSVLVVVFLLAALLASQLRRG